MHDQTNIKVKPVFNGTWI